MNARHGKRSLVRHATFAACIVLALATSATGVRAQVAGADAPDALAGVRLDGPSRVALQRVLDSARADGVPTEPLVSKVLEGNAKGAPGPRIVQVVRSLYHGLGDARAALGAASTEAELVAGAAVLQAGIRPAALVELRRARGSRAVAGPLVVLADLLTRGVPPAAASDAVLRLARANAADASFATLRRDVERDIAAGAAPATAAALRAGSIAPAASVSPDVPEVP